MNQSQVQIENRIWALVAYALAPVGSLVALLLPKARTAGAGDDLALKRHARQGLLAGSAGAVVSTALGLITALSFVGMLLSAAFWLYLVICGMRAYRGEDVAIPLISSMVA